MTQGGARATQKGGQNLGLRCVPLADLAGS